MNPKSPLPYEELTDVIDLSLWAGQLLLQYGAETARIEETVHQIGTGLGCNWMDILVSPNAIIATTSSGDQFRTKVRRVVALGVNFAIVAAVSDLRYRVNRGEMDRFQLRAELSKITKQPHQYNRWMVVGMVGLACAAFSRLFGADVPVFAVTFCASSAAMFVRQELVRRHFNLNLVVIITAFVAALIASLATFWNIGERPDLALAASVLLLIPGVPLINAAEDLIQGHIVTGIARGVIGGIVTLSIAIGMYLALWIMGINNL